MRYYLVIVEKNEKEKANLELKLRTKNYQNLFKKPKTSNNKDITHYICHHPFDEQEAANMREYFTHFYDMSETTKEKVFADLGLGDLPIEEGDINGTI